MCNLSHVMYTFKWEIVSCSLREELIQVELGVIFQKWINPLNSLHRGQLFCLKNASGSALTRFEIYPHQGSCCFIRSYEWLMRKWGWCYCTFYSFIDSSSCQIEILPWWKMDCSLDFTTASHCGSTTSDLRWPWVVLTTGQMSEDPSTLNTFPCFHLLLGE